MKRKNNSNTTCGQRHQRICVRPYRLGNVHDTFPCIPLLTYTTYAALTALQSSSLVLNPTTPLQPTYGVSEPPSQNSSPHSNSFLHLPHLHPPHTWTTAQTPPLNQNRPTFPTEPSSSLPKHAMPRPSQAQTPNGLGSANPFSTGREASWDCFGACSRRWERQTTKPGL